MSSPESVFIGIVNEYTLVRSGFVHLLFSSKALGKEGTVFLNPYTMQLVGHWCLHLHLQVLSRYSSEKMGVAPAGILGFGEGKSQCSEYD